MLVDGRGRENGGIAYRLKELVTVHGISLEV
jgi:hypothetical protein